MRVVSRLALTSCTTAFAHTSLIDPEGVLWYLGKALPMIVAGISDKSDIICDVAMHAGLNAANARVRSNAKDLLVSQLVLSRRLYMYQLHVILQQL
ncbi:hypothetical protein SPRG_05376 [Saprolegnia parasitica CBS 223.65]|uniref:Uncharacterized protein n=1 Tax=Saprolegnia parasitica (strain CBS 223.65) TaxID=695850 RepID=A0A067CF66_SAPPC|nr:hypothetical protein SPRG_05376 [Saprolegnia parasitica CBS 223.65]KDO29133.1 hypothetical protein SPRG_05376 [Saprolegnia parasitica CBS 223.65]|eukprot:XP_012200013.1 hypothetical protein SPRG_05376 [Saprolegnia parasitica CBS 223.65]